MKKKFLPLVLVLVLILTTSANAQMERLAVNSAQLTFDGIQARCDVTIVTTDMKGEISALIELWNGNSRINYWTRTGSGYLSFTDASTPVARGRVYTLKVTYTVNGTAQSPLSTSAACK